MTDKALQLAERVQEAGLVPVSWNQATIMAARSTMYEHLSDKEFVVLVSACQAYGLDPFRREVEIIKGNVFVGRNGWISAMQHNPRYTDHRVGLIYENEVETFYIENGVPHHRQLAPGARGKLVGCWCQIITSDGGNDTFVREPSDYKHLWQRDGWKKDMANMLTIRTICHAARSKFSMSNIYTFDEKDEVLQGEVVDVPTQPEMARERIQELTEQLGGSQGEPDSGPDEATDSDRKPEPEDTPAPPPVHADAKAEFEKQCRERGYDVGEAYELLCDLMQVGKDRRKLTHAHFTRVLGDWESFDVLMREPELNI